MIAKKIRLNDVGLKILVFKFCWIKLRSHMLFMVMLMCVDTAPRVVVF